MWEGAAVCRQCFQKDTWPRGRGMLFLTAGTPPAGKVQAAKIPTLSAVEEANLVSLSIIVTVYDRTSHAVL